MKPSPEQVKDARAWLGRFFDHLPKDQRPAALPYDDARRTCHEALTVLEREAKFRALAEGWCQGTPQEFMLGAMILEILDGPL